jgi:type I restriction enzyme M protein
MLEAELRRRVDQLWDRFWSGGLANPLMAIDQLNYLIFLKRLEAIDDLAARRARVQSRRHASVFDDAEQCRWSHWRNFPAAQMHEHVATVVFPWMKKLSPEFHAFTSYMKDAAFLIPKPSLLVEAVAALDEMRIGDRNTDALGDVYEWMLSKLNVAGQAGQFRTPRHIIRALVEIANPQLGQTVIDPACGTSGFLISSYQHVLADHTSPEFLGRDASGAPQGALGDRLLPKQRRLLQNSLIGFDFDVTMVRIGAMNMVLHGIEHPHVSYADTLGKAFDHSPRAHVVLANPPFSGSLNESEISDEFRIKTTKTELLFVQLILDLLLPGGRAAVVVPDGVLFTRQRAHKGVRRRLMEQNRLDAIVSLPTGVFRPYAGVKTSVLVVTKGGHTDEVWMYRVTADGYSLDDRRMKTDADDLPHLLASWPDRAITDRSFVVPIERIQEHDYELTPSAYADIDDEEIEEADPRALIDDIEGSISAANAAINTLRKALG